ncbi:MAG TPA: hypothetical protein VIN36_11670 [Thiobacillus sp.]
MPISLKGFGEMSGVAEKNRGAGSRRLEYESLDAARLLGGIDLHGAVRFRASETASALMDAPGL